jgi:hypothetical protein
MRQGIVARREYPEESSARGGGSSAVCSGNASDEGDSEFTYMVHGA